MMRIRRQRRTTGTPQIFEEEQEPEVWEVFFVGAKAEFGKVPSQAGSRAVAVGLNMGWAEYMVRLASFRCMHVSVCNTF